MRVSRQTYSATSAPSDVAVTRGATPRVTTPRVTGQATVEAAALLPLLMLLMALLVQPVCVLYTCMVMRHAASATARVAATSADENATRRYAIRRLAAVPEASVFHVGGTSDWNVQVERSSTGGVSVEIAGHVRPLPLLGVVVGALGQRDSQGVLLRVRVVENTRPSWYEGVGGLVEWDS